MTATEIILVRHGETDWNRDRRVQGHTDVPLNDAGRLQAEALAAELTEVPLDAVYSSDLSRARATAQVIAGDRSLEVITLRELRERNFGSWEGLTDHEARRRYPEQTADPRAWGDGETQEQMTTRVLAVLARIGTDHVGGTVLVVSHGGPLRVVLRHTRGNGDGPIGNCEVVRVVVENGTMLRVD